ncbi:DUF6263 family protein [Croceivirga sp. JEA036]|uniref:DUF6263 family protein n=1 Tax=Croceivirga sp. JEA036 TaxID=2721162 RepID=UPI00143BC5EB|nr:DUF6263 family protein [Croceivirga sp. JEA036]NJB37937.1 hypothetical protein [Croceivirga sp. JEA036]
MGRRNLHLTIILLFICITTSYTQTQLGYNLEPGAVFKIKQEAKQLMTQEIQGTKHELTNNLSGIFQFKILEKEPSAFKIELQFVEFGLKTESNLQGVIIEVHTNNPIEGDVTYNMFAQLVDRPLILTMTREGKIITVDGGDELVDNMVNNAGDLDENTKKIMKNSLSKEFSSAGLANSFEQMTYIYPTQPKKVGEEWQTNFKGKITATNNWTLEKVVGKTIFTSGNAEMTMQNADAGFSIDLTGTQELLVEANASTGFINKMMVSGQGTGTSVILANGMEIPTTLEQTITYELITE